jgi:hypothetical protein
MADYLAVTMADQLEKHSVDSKAVVKVERWE